MKITTFAVLVFCLFACVNLLEITFSKGTISSVTCLNKNDKENNYCTEESIITILGELFDINVFHQQQLYLNDEDGIDISTLDSETFFFNESNLTGPLNYYKQSCSVGPHRIKLKSTSAFYNFDYGTLFVGYLYGANISIFTPNKGPPTDVNVTKQLYDTITAGCNFTLHGIFHKDHKYKIIFVGQDKSSEIPTCGEVIGNETTLICNVTSATVSYANYNFLVQDLNTQEYLHASGEFKDLTISKNLLSCPQPPPEPTFTPRITNASGLCVNNSHDCTDGSVLNFTGNDFFPYPTRNRVNIEDAGASNASCEVLNTTNTSLTCKLHNVNKLTGNYTLTNQAQYSSGVWNDARVRMGYLMLGQPDGSPGYSWFYTPTIDNNNVQPSSSSSSSSSSHTKTVTTALTIVFAILFACAVISLIVIYCRFKFIVRHLRAEIEKDLKMKTIENENNNHIVNNKSEPTNYEICNESKIETENVIKEENKEKINENMSSCVKEQQ